MNKARSFFSSKKLLPFWGLLGALMFVAIILTAYQLIGPKQKEDEINIDPAFPSEKEDKLIPSAECRESATGESMAFSEARSIALKSECAAEGSLTEEGFCNESTGTWWLELDTKKTGCVPACVIDIVTKKAEINWRCTGLIPPEEKYSCPSSDNLDCMPIIEPSSPRYQCCQSEYLKWIQENCPEVVVTY